MHVEVVSRRGKIIVGCKPLRSLTNIKKTQKSVQLLPTSRILQWQDSVQYMIPLFLQLMFQINYVCTLCSTLFKIAVLIPCLGTRGAHFSYNFLFFMCHGVVSNNLFQLSIHHLCTIYALIHQYTWPEKSIKQKHVDLMTYVITVMSIFICKHSTIKSRHSHMFSKGPVLKTFFQNSLENVRIYF